ncbi:HI1506-related protein [Pseudomonas sp. I2]|uniref:HI1506-related protein n=1 Tax=Pseudomonas sp. I2 TaxID=1338438 RepID=UPI0034D5A2D7
MGTVIKAKRDGYRRAGLAHCVAGTFHEDGDLSERQLAMLRGDPNLLVVEGAQEDVLQLDQDNDDLIQELGNTIAGLEHDLGQARAGLKSACSDLMAALDRQKAAPGLVVEALKLLEPDDPTLEGVICIKADSLAELIAELLQPQQKTPEAQDDANQSTLGSAGDSEPPTPAPAAAVAQADGAQAGVVSPEKTGKRGKNAQKDAD